MFVEKFQILLGEKTNVGRIFLWIKRCVDMLESLATRVDKYQTKIHYTYLNSLKLFILIFLTLWVILIMTGDQGLTLKSRLGRSKAFLFSLFLLHF